MARRKTKYSILIVCEGTNTEPNYFQGIREEVMRNESIWTEGVSIVIKPKPPLEDEEEDSPTPPHKTQRPRRKIKGTPEDSELEIEDKYKAYPTRFVREAQLGLEDETYDEAWAVFDKDYHADHEKAFNLAEEEINGKNVRIAFSSISFEHWILLHFEKNDYSFQKSECKEVHNNKKKKIFCGTSTHKNDCHGETCVIGYLIEKGYLSTRTKESQLDLYSILKEKTEIAIENACWLRSVNSGTPIYKLNPYTTVDFLVKHLLQLNSDFRWALVGKTIDIEKLEISIAKMPDKKLRISAHNNSKTSKVFRPILTFYINKDPVKGFKLDFGIIPPNETHASEIDASSPIVKTPFDQVKLRINDTQIMVNIS
jgi:hypothetical protein